MNKDIRKQDGQPQISQLQSQQPKYPVEGTPQIQIQHEKKAALSPKEVQPKSQVAGTPQAPPEKPTNLSPKKDHNEEKKSKTPTIDASSSAKAGPPKPITITPHKFGRRPTQDKLQDFVRQNEWKEADFATITARSLPEDIAYEYNQYKVERKQSLTCPKCMKDEEARLVPFLPVRTDADLDNLHNLPDATIDEANRHFAIMEDPISNEQDQVNKAKGEELTARAEHFKTDCPGPPITANEVIPEIVEEEEEEEQEEEPEVEEEAEEEEEEEEETEEEETEEEDISDPISSRLSSEDSMSLKGSTYRLPSTSRRYYYSSSSSSSSSSSYESTSDSDEDDERLINPMMGMGIMMPCMPCMPCMPYPFFPPYCLPPCPPPCPPPPCPPPPCFIQCIQPAPKEPKKKGKGLQFDFLPDDNFCGDIEIIVEADENDDDDQDVCNEGVMQVTGSYALHGQQHFRGPEPEVWSSSQISGSDYLHQRSRRTGSGSRGHSYSYHDYPQTTRHSSGASFVYSNDNDKGDKNSNVQSYNASSLVTSEGSVHSGSGSGSRLSNTNTNTSSRRHGSTNSIRTVSPYSANRPSYMDSRP